MIRDRDIVPTCKNVRDVGMRRLFERTDLKSSG